MGKNIFITGVSTGLGHALAELYLRKGHEVYGVSRRIPADLSTHPDFHFKALDLTDHEKIQGSLGDLFHGTKELDLVILNAGQLGKIADLGEVSLSDLKQTMDINVWSNKVVLDALSDLSLRQVVAISSGAAAAPLRGWSGYAISKAALNMLIGLYAAERPETHFSTLAPCLADTAMQETIRGLSSDPRHPSLDVLRRLHGTANMPSAEKAAEVVASLFEKLLSCASGTFVNANTLLKPTLLQRLSAGTFRSKVAI